MSSDPLTDIKSKAAALREEGNALHRNRRYKEARAKYSEAIELDKENAVLFSNRAACNVALKESVAATGQDRDLIMLINTTDHLSWPSGILMLQLTLAR